VPTRGDVGQQAAQAGCYAADKDYLPVYYMLTYAALYMLVTLDISRA
jgi:hypothetical protein